MEVVCRGSQTQLQEGVNLTFYYNTSRVQITITADSKVGVKCLQGLKYSIFYF